MTFLRNSNLEIEHEETDIPQSRTGAIGADDYVVKQGKARRARPQRAAPRSIQPTENEVFEFEGWQLYPLKRLPTDSDGAVVAISSVEFRLLPAFLEHPRQGLDRDGLLDMERGSEAHLFDRAVDNQVSRLRCKIEVDSRNSNLIQIVWGVGCMLATDVKLLTA